MGRCHISCCGWRCRGFAYSRESVLCLIKLVLLGVLAEIHDFDVHDSEDRPPCGYSNGMYDVVRHGHAGNFICDIWFFSRSEIKQRNQDAGVVDTVILVPTEDHARAMLARSYETQKKKH